MNEHLIHAEIDLGAIAHNVRQLRQITHPEARLLVAVKANGYGHGAFEVARTALQAGADWLGVARLEEALALRRQGVTAPILILGSTPAGAVQYLLDHHLTASVFTLENARQLARGARAAGKTLRVHVKVDSGMGRLGLVCDELRLERKSRAVDEIAAIGKCKGLCLEGVFTHFATSDEKDKTYARRQFSLFQTLLRDLDTAGIRIPIRHAANSGAIIDMPETHLDMVRAGVSVYGLYPSPDVDHARIVLIPALALKAKVLYVKQVPAGTRISYGGTHVTPSATTVATVAAGYGDGYNRRLSNCGSMLIHGQRVPIIGRVCMDLTMVDVGRIPGVRIGDEAVLIGRQGEARLSAEELAQTLATINYEVVTALTGRVKRVYIE